MNPADSAPEGRELHLESILGLTVHDRTGERVGRLEEVIAEWDGPDLVVVEYHLGPAAALERIIDFAGALPPLGVLRRFVGRRYCARWDQMDLSDPDHPRLTVARAELVQPEARSMPR